MVNHHLVWYLETNNLISNKQCGYKKKMRLHKPLNKPQKLYKRRLYKKEHAINIFDLEKAYDTTWKFGIIKDLYDLKL